LLPSYNDEDYWLIGKWSLALNGFNSERETEPLSTERQISPWGRFLLETIQTILLALVLYLLIDTVIARVRVDNISMKPTLKPDDFVVVNKMAYRIGDIQRGDIVVFHNPQQPQEDYIKRVIGLPGDIIVVRDGQVLVNGTPLNEPYIAAPPDYPGQWEVPPGNLYVLGDNRNNSSDSHSWGFVPIRNVVGKALVDYWPAQDFRILTHPTIVNAAN